jgi:hypothetical protein
MRKEVGLQLLLTAWCGVALNEGKTEEGKTVYKDGNTFGMNCAVPWGEYTFGDVC